MLAREKLSMLLLRMHVHPGDANRRLASEWLDIKLVHGYLTNVDLHPAIREQFNALIALIEADAKWLDGVRSPRGLGRIRNTTSAKYIALLMRIQAEYLE